MPLPHPNRSSSIVLDNATSCRVCSVFRTFAHFNLGAKMRTREMSSRWLDRKWLAQTPHLIQIVIDQLFDQSELNRLAEILWRGGGR